MGGGIGKGGWCGGVGGGGWRDGEGGWWDGEGGWVWLVGGCGAGEERWGVEERRGGGGGDGWIVRR